MDLTGTLNVAHGGTGDTTFTPNAPIIANTTSTGALTQATSGFSNSGYILTSTGSSSAPTWQAVSATGAVTNFTVDAATGTGTNPVVPNAGNISILGGAIFATGSRANPIEVVSTAANTISLEIQYAGSNAGSSATNDYGVSQFNSNNFNVSSGFVSSLPITINTTGTISGGGTVNLGGTITLTGSPSTLNYTNVNHASSPYTVISTDQYISVDCSAGTVSLLFPNTTTSYKTWIVKDRIGSSSTYNISITTVGGGDDIDGETTYLMASNFSSIQLLFNGTNYEVY